MDPDGDKSQTDAPTYCADGPQPSATLLKREERGVKHAGRSKHGLQLQQGRKNRIQCEVTEQRIGKGDICTGRSTGVRSNWSDAKRV